MGGKLECKPENTYLRSPWVTYATLQVIDCFLYNKSFGVGQDEGRPTVAAHLIEGASCELLEAFSDQQQARQTYKLPMGVYQTLYSDSHCRSGKESN
jgi:hypothetical protein